MVAVAKGSSATAPLGSTLCHTNWTVPLPWMSPVVAEIWMSWGVLAFFCATSSLLTWRLQMFIAGTALTLGLSFFQRYSPRVNAMSAGMD